MPKMRAIDIKRLPVFILAVSLILTGCGRSVSDDKDVIASVNKDVIYKADLERDIALRAKLDPEFKLSKDTKSEQLDAMIDRKIIVQYAMEKGLAREERFVNTIRTIWEHTLIRDFIDYKKKELQDYLFATDDDIARYYDNMSYTVTFKVFKSRSKKAADEAYTKYLADKDTSAWQTVGPIAYEDVGMIALLDAFEMEKGRVARVADEPNYYIIEVIEKEKHDLAPLADIKDEVEKRAISLKEKRLFEEWLKEQKKKSKIVVKDYSI